MAWGTRGHCHKGCPVVLLQHLKNDLQLLLCGGAELQEGGALLLREQGGPVSYLPQLPEPVARQLPRWLLTRPGSFSFGSTGFVWGMFNHITEFFQSHLKKLTLHLTLLPEGSCRDPEGNSEGWRNGTYLQSQRPIWSYNLRGELLRFEGLSVAACDVTTMNSPHIFPSGVGCPFNFPPAVPHF